MQNSSQTPSYSPTAVEDIVGRTYDDDYVQNEYPLVPYSFNFDNAPEIYLPSQNLADLFLREPPTRDEPDIETDSDRANSKPDGTTNAGG